MAQDETDFFNPYRVLRRPDGSLWTLGTGRLGVIYKARHELTELDVALRVVNPELVGPETQATLARAQQISRAVHSPAIAEIREVLTFDGKIILIEEYAQGDSLEQIVAQRGPLSSEIALSIAGQAADALDVAHRAGWVHGNITPSNFLGSKLGPVLRLKMTGYGLRLLVAPTVPPGTDFPSFDPKHASPEQIAGQPPDARSDIYSLGSTLWHIVTGALPFDLDPAGVPDRRRILLAHPRMSEGMNDLLARMLATDPAHRPQSAGELVSMINACASPEETSEACAATMVGSGAKKPTSGKTVIVNAPHISITSNRSSSPAANEVKESRVNPDAVISDTSADTAVGAAVRPPEFEKAVSKPSPSDDVPEALAATMVSSATRPTVEEKSAVESTTESPVALDENIQFTAYRPKTVRPARWAKLLVFAHLDERPLWMDDDERGPLEEVAAQAQQFLGDKIADYRATTEDSRLAIPRDGEITLVPTMKGVEFNPPRRSFFWKDGISVHAETFEMRAAASLDGQITRGQLTIFLGALILAEINLAVRVNSQQAVFNADDAGSGRERSSARPFRRIFASYSHRDLDVVESVERHARTLGDEYLRDLQQLRSGESWNSRLLQMIDQADVFQLFWSSNAASSEFVQQEWRHALALCRNTFVRPTYWQEPMPPVPGPLQSLHFHRLGIATAAAQETARSQSASHPRPVPPPPPEMDAYGSGAALPASMPPPPPPPPQMSSRSASFPESRPSASPGWGSGVGRWKALSAVVGACVAMLSLFFYQRNGSRSQDVAMRPPEPAASGVNGSTRPSDTPPVAPVHRLRF